MEVIQVFFSCQRSDVLDKFKSGLLGKLFNGWQFEHCVTPTQSNIRRDELIKQGYKAKTVVKGSAFGVYYKKC